MDDAKAALLARVLDEVARNGLADRSLRELAAAAGTSHRMLLYHFGSRDGLVAEIVGAVEASQRDALRQAAVGADGADEVVRAVWRRVSDPSLRPFVQLFFEAVAYASRQGSGAGFTDAWLASSADVTARMGTPYDPVATRLGIAVVRGLLIDVITTDATEEATAALERFLALWERDRH